MSAVNWAQFETLPGAQQANFETLCRGLIRLHYGPFGALRATANQPGVEFHLKLHTQCALGSPPQWFGWQCKWYDLPSGRAIGPARRKKILASIRTTERVLPEITDWVLWTRHNLTAGDQKWFYGLKTKMRLALATSADAEILLSGDATILRGTFFGEFALTPGNLSALHDASVASVRHRWLPEAHQPVAAERVVRRMLGEASAWNEMVFVADRLALTEKTIESGVERLSQRLAPLARNFAHSAAALGTSLRAAQQLLTDGSFDLLRDTLNSRPHELDRTTASVPRLLRAARSPMSFEATNGLADVRLGHRLLHDMDSYLGTGLVAVIADAGSGKTQLAAQLTAPQSDRPAGILLHGRNLAAGQSLDHLAQRVVFQGRPFPTIEALVAALDAAGQRARRRLPLVIDGLNEAEDPRDWKGPLASLNVLLGRFANVLAVCTLRTGARRLGDDEFFYSGPKADPATRTVFAEMALPDDVQRLTIEGFAEDTAEAIRRYFTFYRINAADAYVPWDLLTHPLQLRLFCDVTNPTREREVGIEAMPRSLTALFERYLADATTRVAELAPKASRYYAQDVRAVLDEFGTQLWDRRVRQLDERRFRVAIGDDGRLWDHSLVRLLEQEGVILRVEGASPGQQSIIPVYDALGGYMVANSLLSRLGREAFSEWISRADTLAAFSGTHTELHPLSSDIFRALAGLVPRLHARRQLWPLVADPLRELALLAATRLEAEFIDAETVTAIRTLIRQQNARTSVFAQLQRTRSSPNHPLNSELLDSELRTMTNEERDLRWTEWLRHGYEKNWDLSQFGTHWRDNMELRTVADRLQAKWGMWYLTSTARELRNKATRALYWFGRGDPPALFDLTLGSLSISDPYVKERMLAASYGVAMAVHSEIQTKGVSVGAITDFARGVYENMFKPGAPHGTTHLLTREYGRRIIELAIVNDDQSFTPTEKTHVTPPYQFNGLRAWQESTADAGEYDIRSPFGMDFVNYTIGGLVPDRANYDFSHPGYLKVRSQILSRVYQLGWSPERLGAIDRQIQSKRDYHSRNDKGTKLDRYGRKYSSIAYLEMSGFLEDGGLRRHEYPAGRTSEVDLDPSFPDPPSEEQLITEDLLGDASTSIREWIDDGPVPNLERYLRQKQLDGSTGPWIALDGYVTQEDKRRGRRLFCFVRAFFASKAKSAALKRALAKQSMHGRWLEEKPTVLYTFAGEMPWSSAYPESGKTRLRFVVGERKFKVRKRQPVYFVDGKPLSIKEFLALSLPWLDQLTDPEKAASQPQSEVPKIETRNMLVETEEIRQQTIDFDVAIPVCDFAWEGVTIDDRFPNSPVLSKQVATALRLVNIPQTTALSTKEGDRATCSTASRRRSYQNSEHFFFLRQDLLERYLKQKRLSMIWVTWGEREISTDRVQRWRGEAKENGPSYKVFSDVRSFG